MPTAASKRGKKAKKKKHGAKKHRRGVSSNGRADSPTPSDTHDWPAWCSYLQRREQPRLLQALFAHPGKSSPLLWGTSELPELEDSRKLVKQIEKQTRKVNKTNGRLVSMVEVWLAELGARPVDPGLGLESLAWCHALPVLSRILTTGPWHQLLDELLDLVRASNDTNSAADPLATQLLAGELPLTLSLLLPELARCRDLHEQASLALCSALTDLTDGEGLVHARHVSLLRGLLACWTRCQQQAEAAGSHCFDKDASLQYEWLVRQALRLTRGNGLQVLSLPRAARATSGRSDDMELLRCAVEVTGDEDDRIIAMSCLPGSSVGKEKKRRAAAALPEVSVHSEWSELTVMRSTWKRDATMLAIDFSSGQCRIELSLGKRILLAGLCETVLKTNGSLPSPTSDWREICWYTDEDGDYLELEQEFGSGCKLQRQFYLGRHDSILLLADAVLTDRSQRIEYQARIPVSETSMFALADETTEGFLGDDKNLACVMPLALPEHRSEPGPGSLTFDDGAMVLAQQTEGQRLYAPLFLDLRRRRFGNQLTWRRLTVAESLQTCRNDVAVGYRVQTAMSQWLLYRSLAASANRTVLGQNTSFEFVFGRFRFDGEIEELIEIE